MRDLANSLHVMAAIAPAAAITDNTPLVGAWIDRSGYEMLMFAIQAGALADPDATFAVTVDAADLADKSDAVAVPVAKLTGTLAQAGFRYDSDGLTRKIGYVGTKRYVRLTITPANNGATAFISALAVLSSARYGPTPNPPA